MLNGHTDKQIMSWVDLTKALIVCLTLPKMHH